jgi:hypothetical protein
MVMNERMIRVTEGQESGLPKISEEHSMEMGTAYERENMPI